MGEAGGERGAGDPGCDGADALREVVHLRPVFRSREEREGRDGPGRPQARVHARLRGALVAQRTDLRDEVSDGLRRYADLTDEEGSYDRVRGLPKGICRNVERIRDLRALRFKTGHRGVDRLLFRSEPARGPADEDLQCE